VPVVTFLSDFGHTETFVGQMKGVVVSACPTVTLIDLTHEIPPQDILAGALHLGAATQWFPDDAIHVAVVDPGVGTERRATAVRTERGFFLAPDNGLLSFVIRNSRPVDAVDLQRPESEPGEISRTFHGRDVFAWAAGQLAAGASLNDLGTSFDPAELLLIDIPEPEIGVGTISGEVVFVDHYGNAVSNIPADELGNESLSWSVSSGEFAVERLVSTYAEVEVGAPLAAISSLDTIELGIRNGSAAARYDLKRGMPVVARRVN
jgi:S-adenosyl-L-methionine hydrolase (adenosine-forming)